jgi:hypothetical protein
VTSNRNFQLPLTLAVGVTGHRTFDDAATVRAQLDAVFSAIGAALATLRSATPSAAPVTLRIISPLAEGADRLAAEAGLATGASLHCPLPFERAEYAKDFAEPASKDAFDQLLSKAERVLELDGAPERRDLAYLAAGQVVVGYSDVLVAVWDGEPSRGRGGTAEIIAEALKESLIVIAVDPAGVRPPSMLHGVVHDPRFSDLAGLTARIANLLTLPSVGRNHAGRVEFGLTAERAGDAERAIAASRSQWTALFSKNATLSRVCAPCMESAPEEAFARADTLANRYAKLYRRTFLINFVLSALAVTMALVGEQHPHVWIRLAELVSIMVIIVLTWIANRRDWHERWIEYRHLAEQLRPLRFLFPLAVNLPKSRGGRPVQDDERLNAWADWLVRRIEVGLGFPAARMDDAYLAAVKAFVIDDILGEQIRYHDRKAERMHHVDHLFHKVGTGLFLFSAVACVLAVVDLAWPRMFETGMQAKVLHMIEPWLIIASGVLPAFGAALLGIRNVGEYDRLERRSTAMASALSQTRTVLMEEKPARLHRETLAAHMEALSAQMISETADWRTLVITRRIEWPG